MTEQRIIDMAAEAYISVMGIEKWYSLTAQQKHDAVMIMLRDLNSALDRM